MGRRFHVSGCWEGVVHFAYVIDVFSRMIVGWQLATNMRTLWRADGFDAAIAQAEREARDYASGLGAAEYIGLAQAYQLYGPPVDGAEVSRWSETANSRQTTTSRRSSTPDQSANRARSLDFFPTVSASSGSRARWRGGLCLVAPFAERWSPDANPAALTGGQLRPDGDRTAYRAPWRRGGADADRHPSVRGRPWLAR